MNCTGRQEAAASKEPRAPVVPARITATVPTTGSSAIAPGKGSLDRMVRAASAINAMPTHPMIARGSALSRNSVSPTRASMPPRPNSHARVNVEKYATDGFVAEYQTEYAKLARTITPRTTRASPRNRPRAARTARATAAKTIGHTK